MVYLKYQNISLGIHMIYVTGGQSIISLLTPHTNLVSTISQESYRIVYGTRRLLKDPNFLIYLSCLWVSAVGSNCEFPIQKYLKQNFAVSPAVPAHKDAYRQGRLCFYGVFNSVYFLFWCHAVQVYSQYKNKPFLKK